MRQGKIVRVAGPLVVASDCLGAKMYDMVKIGELGLIGEIIELKEDRASIQVYEDTTGMGPGEPVFLTGSPFRSSSGPGSSAPSTTASSGRSTSSGPRKGTSSRAASRCPA